MAENQVLRTYPLPKALNVISGGMLRWILVAAVVLAVSFAVAGSFFSVQQYEGAVVTTWGKFSHTAEPGLNWKIPFVQAAHPIRTDLRTLTPPDPKGVIQAQAEALRQNTGLVELRKAEKWNGALPQQLLSGVVPFMQFSAPEARAAGAR